MTRLIRWLNLQLFADGGDGAGTEAGTGETTAADAGQRLRELGVPEDKLRRRANKQAAVPQGSAAKAPEPQQPAPQAAAAQETSDDEETEEQKAAPARMSWDDIMADPEYNKAMQAVVRARIGAVKSAEDSLGQLGPALELLARKHNLDPDKPDYAALSKAIVDDDSFYEDKAMQMGVTVETAKKIDRTESEAKRLQREQARTIEQQKLQQHFQRLEQQSEAVKQIFLAFDLKAELQNPVFARMTSPNVGVNVEDAYYAIHHKEIQTAAMQVTAQKAAQKLSNSIQAGQKRPDENGTSAQAPSVTTFDYSKASREEREALKKAIRTAAAHGEKVYPGMR